MTHARKNPDRLAGYVLSKAPLTYRMLQATTLMIPLHWISNPEADTLI